MANYTDYQQRALYGAGQSASRAGQRFHMERDALRRGDKDAAKYHRSRANALNRQGAYAAVRGMGGNEGANQYFPVTSDGQPIQSGSGIALSSAGRDIFDKFRQQGFVKPIREKKRYAPNTEPKGLGFLIDKIASNTLGGKILSSMGNKKPKPDDAYYKSLWGQGLNEMYEPSGIFKSGEFLGNEKIDPYYERPYTGPKWAERFLKPFVQPRSDAFDVVRDSSIPEDWEFMQEAPKYPSPLKLESPNEIVDKEQTIQEKYNIPDFFPMSRDFAPKFTTADLPPLERFPDLGKDHSIWENLDEVGFWDSHIIPTDVEEVLDDEITDNIDVEIKEKPPFPGDDTFDPEIDGQALVEEAYNKQYSFVNENPDLTPYEWIMTMFDELKGSGVTIDDIVQNGILQGIIIENNV